MARQLSLTEELEKVEQQITLTLQEIDRNFSHTHRVVTSSILPIVEQYAAHSRDVWEGARFWKQFFESSANVSLSGYEEQPDEATEQSLADTRTDTDIGTDTDTEQQIERHASQSLEESEYSTPSAHQLSISSVADLDISRLSLSPSKSSTPRPPHRQKQPQRTDHTATFADYPSPYEALHAEVSRPTKVSQRAGPTTPGRQHDEQNEQNERSSLSSSPFLPPTSIPRPSTARQKNDPLLCRVLDRNYRIQATPLRNHTSAHPITTATTAGARTTTPGRQQSLADVAFSSSPIAPPELHEELFSPLRKRATPRQTQTQTGPKSVTRRTPGPTALTARQPPQFWDDSDEEEDDETSADPSPPKTMQFHVPQSRLLKTPAKQASRQMVRDILASAGVGRDEDEDEDEDEIELDMDTTDYGDQDNSFNDYDYDYDDGHGRHGNGNGNINSKYSQEEASPSVVRKAAVDEIF